jgi:hypothetical protein
MVDRLDRQILETIANAPSLVRTVTRREIEAGVLFPSATALDIKRNLPGQVSLNLVESRLGSLERDGYIFFNEGRWWLSRKGRKELGVGEEEERSDMGQRPVRAVLEETFTRHQKAQDKKEDFTVADAILRDLYADPELGEETRAERVMQVLGSLPQGQETRDYLASRMESLSSEVRSLEEELARKKAELERVKRLLGSDKHQTAEQ